MKTSLLCLCLSILSSCGDKEGVDTSQPSDPPVVVDVSCRDIASVDDWGVITIPVADVEARYPELGLCCDWAGEWTVELYSTPTKQYHAPLVIEAAADGAIMLVGDFSEYYDEITACDLAMWRTD
jgi:hypothetical protein